MSNRGATPSELKECKEIFSAIDKAMDGKKYDAILNTLCFVVGNLGPEIDMSKQEFIAQVVNQVSSAYDMTNLYDAEPEGEA